MSMLKTMTKWLAGAALAGALLFAAPQKAEAQRVGFGISIGGPVYGGGYYPYAAPSPYYAGYPAYYGGYYGPHYYGRPYYGGYRGGYYGRGYVGGYRGGYGRGGYGGGFRGGRR